MRFWGARAILFDRTTPALMLVIVGFIALVFLTRNRFLNAGVREVPIKYSGLETVSNQQYAVFTFPSEPRELFSTPWIGFPYAITQSFWHVFTDGTRVLISDQGAIYSYTNDLTVLKLPNPTERMSVEVEFWVSQRFWFMGRHYGHPIHGTHLISEPVEVAPESRFRLNVQ
jgi:hypothetical protein